MCEAVQAVLGAAHHQDLVYPDKPHRLGVQLDAIFRVLGVSGTKTPHCAPREPLAPAPADDPPSKAQTNLDGGAQVQVR